ncbi:unnamed protein product [Trichogramma brassicae]|uniref:Uncharacterized protein n=1 Tax=Trichogramma brassicae TaxID=86971 RepID=A0A6H5J1V3_9HYME|nr:unnamed protein product [Trichogramma brassicae]
MILMAEVVLLLLLARASDRETEKERATREPHTRCHAIIDVARSLEYDSLSSARLAFILLPKGVRLALVINWIRSSSSSRALLVELLHEREPLLLLRSTNAARCSSCELLLGPLSSQLMLIDDPPRQVAAAAVAAAAMVVFVNWKILPLLLSRSHIQYTYIWEEVDAQRDALPRRSITTTERYRRFCVYNKSVGEYNTARARLGATPLVYIRSERANRSASRYILDIRSRRAPPSLATYRLFEKVASNTTNRAMLQKAPELATRTTKEMERESSSSSSIKPRYSIEKSSLRKEKGGEEGVVEKGLQSAIRVFARDSGSREGIGSKERG